MADYQARLVEENFDDIVNMLAGTDLDGTHEILIRKVKKGRTDRQNRALHVYFDILCTKLNAAGFDQVELMRQYKDGFDLPWTKDAIKGLFQRIAGIVAGEDRTHKLSTTELQDVYNVFDRGISEKTGIHVPFPSVEPPLIGGTEDDYVPNSRQRRDPGSSPRDSGSNANDLNNDMSPPVRESEGSGSDSVPGSDRSDRGGQGR